MEPKYIAVEERDANNKIHYTLCCTSIDDMNILNTQYKDRDDVELKLIDDEEYNKLVEESESHLPDVVPPTEIPERPMEIPEEPDDAFTKSPRIYKDENGWHRYIPTKMIYMKGFTQAKGPGHKSKRQRMKNKKK